MTERIPSPLNVTTPLEAADIAHELALRGAHPSPAELQQLASLLPDVREPGRQMAFVHDYLSLLPSDQQAEALAELVRTGSVSAREAAIEDAAHIGAPALEMLATLTRSRDPVTRWHAYQAIRHIGGTSAIPLLIAGLNDDDLGIRWVASDGLQEAGPAAFLPVVHAIIDLEATIPFHKAARRVLRRIRPSQAAPEVDALIESLARWTTTVESKGRAVDLLVAMERAGAGGLEGIGAPAGAAPSPPTGQLEAPGAGRPEAAGPGLGADPAPGHRRWVIPEGYIPGWSSDASPEMTSHETACILNASDADAHVRIVVYFTDREPAGPYSITVPARRTRHVRFNDLRDPEEVPLATDFASVIEADVPIVVQHTRLDSRQADLALLSTIAFPDE